MSELLPPPPPRRPAPDQLRQRIENELARAERGRRLALAPVVALVAAAAVVIAAVLGVTAYRQASTAEPATTVSPSPATPSAPGTMSSTPSTDPTDSGPQTLDLDVRAMSDSETANVRKSCLGQADADLGPGSDAKPAYTRWVRRAGLTGPTWSQAQALILADQNALWDCADGGYSGPSVLGSTRPTTAVPVVEVPDFGGAGGTCVHRSNDIMTSENLFEVGDAVAQGRIRLNEGDQHGPWQTLTPSGGYLYLSAALIGADAWRRSITLDYEFLDAAGKRLTVQPYGERGTPTAQRVSEEFGTCGDAMARIPRQDPTSLKPPASDAAGAKACVKLAKQSSSGGEVSVSGWRRALVLSGSSWGAVLVKGDRRFACSLAPTREVSAVVSDKRSTATSSFWFATNPIDATEGASFWAAGRVPANVTGITYVLPGGVRVPATIAADGHWMAMYSVDGKDLAPQENTADWDPVKVTITRSSGAPIMYTIPFDDKTMCNQVSHGC